MAARERSISDVLQDIVANVQDIIRSEARLARSELLLELTKIKRAVPLLIFGGMAGLLASLFLIWAIVYALALVLPIWAAALIAAALLAAVAAVILMEALKRLRQVNSPQRTIASLKENMQWTKQQAK